MTNKDIKKLVENLEHTLVSMQNDRNRDSFNLKLNKDRVAMLEAKLELKLEILNNRNNQVKEMSDKIQGLEKQVKNFDNLVNEKNESIGNLEFLIDKKNEEIELLKKTNKQRQEMLDEFDNSEGLIRNILDNPNLTDLEIVTEIRKIF